MLFGMIFLAFDFKFYQNIGFLFFFLIYLNLKPIFVLCFIFISQEDYSYQFIYYYLVQKNLLDETLINFCFFVVMKESYYSKSVFLNYFSIIQC